MSNTQALQMHADYHLWVVNFRKLHPNWIIIIPISESQISICGTFWFLILYSYNWPFLTPYIQKLPRNLTSKFLCRISFLIKCLQAYAQRQCLIGIKNVRSLTEIQRLQSLVQCQFFEGPPKYLDYKIKILMFLECLFFSCIKNL